jgi:protein-S-isoprenylcysteine O-methyltransferase Ste14
LNEPRAAARSPASALGVARKIAIEGKLLGSRFGEEYAAYRKKVCAIIPFIL